MEFIDEITRNEIDQEVWKVLKEAGLTEPPVKTQNIIDHLNLHRDFYSLEDPKFSDVLLHKMKIQKNKLVLAIKKIKFVAAWTPDNSTIYIDSTLPEPKKRWASGHEVIHSLLEWHKPYFLGDTAQTLDPASQLKLEAEANYGASALLFCGEKFTQEAKDTEICWKSIEMLKKRYNGSWVTVVRRYVQHSHLTPMVGFVSTAPWDDKPEDQNSRCRHFVPSSKFESEFSNVTEGQILKAIDQNVSFRRGGKVGDFEFEIEDDNGEANEFRVESFYNTHYIVTLIHHLHKITGSRILF